MKASLSLCIGVFLPMVMWAGPRDTPSSYSESYAILIKGAVAGSETVAETLNNIILRLLSQAPPARVSFTIIDPVRLGQNFAGGTGDGFRRHRRTLFRGKSPKRQGV